MWRRELEGAFAVFRHADGSGTTATYTSTYDSADDLQKVLDMGVEEGAISAINQIDAHLEAA